MSWLTPTASDTAINIFKCYRRYISFLLGHIVEHHGNPMKRGGLDPNVQRLLILMRKTNKTKVLDSLQHISLTHTPASRLTAPFLCVPMSLCTPGDTSGNNLSESAWRYASSTTDGVNLPLSFLTFFVSEPWEGNYGGCLLTNLDQMKTKCRDQSK